jgi:uncharacterized ion transporter superfamily protein YfcC
MMRPRFPHPLVLLVSGIFLAALLTWIVPAGQYDRRMDDAAGRKVVVPGTYHHVAPAPAGPYQAVVEIPKGMVDAGDIIFFVFLVGGAFAVVDRTGALRQAVDTLTHRLRDRRGWIIPVVCVVFALGGILENLQEEIIAMVPVLLLLCRRLGYEPLTAVAMSLGAASVGSAFSPVNPFQALIAQQVAGVRQFSGWGYRLAFLVPALALWIWGVRRYAARSARLTGDEEPVATDDEHADAGERSGEPTGGSRAVGGPRTILILGLVGATFAVFIYGVLQWKWDFEQDAAAFFIMGIAAGLVGRLGLNGTAEAFVEGFGSMTFAALLIGFSRAIYVALDDGKVVDTLVLGMFVPLGHLPVTLSAVGMMLGQTLLHFPVPSVSGQAVLTLPILAPLSDLLGLTRQVAVLAYQYGAGLCELLTPTNAALMAILGASRVRFDDWLRFVWPLYLGLAALGLVAVLVAVATGLH